MPFLLRAITAYYSQLSFPTPMHFVEDEAPGHDARHLWSAHNGRKHSAGGVVSGEAGLRHDTGAVLEGLPYG